MATLGILPLARATFDMGYAGEKLAAMLAALDATGHVVTGPRHLLTDTDAARAALAGLAAAPPDLTLILQVTFTDAAMAVEVAETLDTPLAVWAVPEPRLGGRLRLNAFCGLNLASHALRRNGRAFGWLYADAADADLAGLIAGRRTSGMVLPSPSDAHASPAGHRAAQGLRNLRIARIGAHPDGFDTCAYDAGALHDLAGVEVVELDLASLFAAAQAADAGDVAATRAVAAAALSGLDAVDQDQLDRSLRLKVALDGLREQQGYDAFAIRCWPETFTEYGGAVCGPVSMLGEARVPCACEADVYGALSQLLLQEVADAPVFLVDLVDMDVADNTGVVWHCGQAPISMADPEALAMATIHTNRRMPLLYEFPLRPGPVTFARVSQAHGSPRLVLAEGEMLARPMAFTGTSGVVRFARPAGAVLDDIIGCGLEHHMALAYGHHAAALRAAAAALNLPLVEL